LNHAKSMGNGFECRNRKYSYQLDDFGNMNQTNDHDEISRVEPANAKINKESEMVSPSTNKGYNMSVSTISFAQDTDFNDE